MKTVKLIVFFLVAGLLPVFNSCKETEEQEVPVDLRFDVQDSYTIQATSPDPISFVVRSTAAWEVYSYNPEWCEISPSSGDAGEESTTVTVTYHDSDQLEARKDTLAIESGNQLKLVTVIQEGMAYLTVDRTDITVPPTGDEVTVNVSSNQKWTAQITEGADWFSIIEGQTGDGDGKFVLSVPENTGEIRTGQVTLYDRDGASAAVLTITEDGVLLVPEVLEIRALFDTESVELQVEANVSWVAESGADWLSFETAEFEGNGTLKINLKKNESGGLRKDVVIIKVNDPDGKSSISKEVTLKQAGEQRFTRYDFSNGFGRGQGWQIHEAWTDDEYAPTVDENGAVHFAANGSRIVKYSYEFPHNYFGDYRFRVRTLGDDTILNIYFQFYGLINEVTEIRWHLNAGTGMTDISTAPNSSVNQYNVAFDKNAAHDVVLKMSEDNGYIHFEWWLDDVKLTEVSSNEGFMANASWIPTTPEKVMQIQLGSDYTKDGNAIVEYYEYAEPISWE